MKKFARGLLVTAAVLLCVFTAYADDSFSCAVTDQQGNVIYGYHDTEKDQWYLFLTNQVAISDMEVQLQGEVASVEKGTVAQETNVLSQAFEQSGDSVVVSLADGTSETITVMQSELPSLYVALDGATLDEVHQDKSVKYAGTAVTLTDTANEENDLRVTNATFKGRGNSSWVYYEKKGYQIKFDKKTSVLGMAKAKKWVLLANASDDSMMRNKLAFDLADQIGMTYAPDGEYVDLWINGDYRGTYLICEKAEIGGSRLDLNDPKGILMELDEGFYEEEDIWIKNNGTGRHFALKESVTEDDPALLQVAVQEFDEALDAFVEYLTITPNGDVTLDALSKYIDVDSFLQYYLVNEYTLNRESVSSSFYWYKDGSGDVLHLGPVWDFDTCMGNDLNAEDSSQKYHIYVYTVYWKLLSVPVVQQALSGMYVNNFSLFTDMSQNAEEIYSKISSSAEMNYTRWNTLIGGVSGKGTYFANSYVEASDNLQKWLSDRNGYFDLSDVYQMRPISVSVNADAAELTIHYQDGKQYEAVDFAVWSKENGQDDLNWYHAYSETGETWSYTVDLNEHGDTGVYYIHTYVTEEGKRYSTRGTESYVESFRRTERPAVSAEVSTDCRTMKVVAKNVEGYDAVYFPVWSEVNGQDDIVWYPAEKQADGTWTCTVNLANHNSTGEYLIHVYGKKDGKLGMITSTTANVEKLVAHVTAEVSADYHTMSFVVADIDDCNQVYLAAWSEANGQDDLVWYPAEKQADGTWACTVDLSNHNSTGKYLIHVYEKKNDTMEKIASTTANVEKLPPRVTAEVSADYRTMRLVVTGVDGYDQVYLPTWSVVNGQDDIVWYSAEKQTDGTWACTADLSNHNSTGKYLIHVYGKRDGKQELLTSTTANVEKLASQVTAEVSGDCRTMRLTVANIENCDQVYLATWSVTDGQDDLVWYPAAKQADGTWAYTVDLRKHHTAGQYLIHVYGRSEQNSELRLLTKTTAYVKRAVLPDDPYVTVELSADCRTMKLTVQNASKYERVYLPVWSEINGQDDLIWYAAQRTADGLWVYTVDMTAHHSAGTYYVHVYGEKGGELQLLASAAPSVKLAAA